MPDPRKLQELLDELAHALTRTSNAAHELAALAVELCTNVLVEQLRKPVDGPKGGAQVVGDRAANRFELLIRALEAGGAVGDAAFKLLVELPQRGFTSLAIVDVDRVNGQPLRPRLNVHRKPALRAVSVGELIFDPRRDARLHHALQPRENRRLSKAWVSLSHQLAFERLRRAAAMLRRFRVHVQKRPV